MSTESPRRRRRPTVAQEAAPEAATRVPALFLTQSVRAALVGLDAFEANLRIWRNVLDAVREAGRVQQDAVFDNVRIQLRRSGRADEEALEAPALMAPLLAARRAYEQVGDAVLAAQRRALDQMSAEARPR